MTPPVEPDRLDIDVRFLLANERTLLAWLRTALTLLAGGVALIQLVGDRPVLLTVGIGLLTLGIAAAVAGYRRFRAASRAIHTGRLPESGRGPVLMTVGVIAVAVALIVIYTLDRLV